MKCANSAFFQVFTNTKCAYLKRYNIEKSMCCHCYNYTFHWLISVIGQIIRFPPPISGALGFLSLLKEKGLTRFLTASWDRIEISPKPLASPETWVLFWVVMHPLPESDRRDIVIIVFPRPIASAKILQFTKSVNKMYHRLNLQTRIADRHGKDTSVKYL